MHRGAAYRRRLTYECDERCDGRSGHARAALLGETAVARGGNKAVGSCRADAEAEGDDVRFGAAVRQGGAEA